MSKFLQELHQEYYSLNDKLSQVSNLIVTYGGVIPDKQQPQTQEISQSQNTQTTTQFAVTPSDEGYPTSGTLKDKIMFALKEIGRPAIAKEIANIILKTEEPNRVRPESITQYLSNLGISGDIGVDNSQFRNKYFLKP